MFRPNCRAILRLMFEQLECTVVLYISYYILAHRIIQIFFIIRFYYIIIPATCFGPIVEPS